MNRTSATARVLATLGLALLAWGCGGYTNSKTTQFNSASGTHSKDWLNVHWAEFLKNQDQCRSCHGSTSDPAQAGGISGVSCFTCHVNGPSHQPGWKDHMKHGRAGAQLAATTTSGFGYCFKCHGSVDSAPVGVTPSCMACHTLAPHPNKPWSSATLTASSHTLTDESNAAECVKCHLDGANSTLVPLTPAPAGTAPGCFNNTMCHGRTIPPATSLQPIRR